MGTAAKTPLRAKKNKNTFIQKRPAYKKKGKLYGTVTLY